MESVLLLCMVLGVARSIILILYVHFWVIVCKLVNGWLHLCVLKRKKRHCRTLLLGRFRANAVSWRLLWVQIYDKEVIYAKS